MTGDWRFESGLKWRPLMPFGAELDIDLSAPLPEPAAARFVSLLWQSSLLLARHQSLTMQRQQQLMGLLGPILQRAGENGYISTETGQEVSLSELPFHADAAYTTAPFDSLSLHAVDVVDGSSSTRFASAQRAHDALSPALLEQLAAHRVEMISPGFETLSRRTCQIRDPKAMKRGELPSVQINPHNGGSCLWVSEMQAARLLGMEWEASGALLGAVFDRLYAPDNVYEHVWQQGDIVIWDNIALQHARGSLKGVGKRVLQRVIVGTEGVCPHIGPAVDTPAGEAPAVNM
jgi:taurine dioxygenase